jgi:hypothetical protein
VLKDFAKEVERKIKRMGETANGETSIRVVLFSGKSADWTTWEEKFVARAKRKGYKDILLGKVKIPLVTDMESVNKKVLTQEITEEEKQQFKKVLELNDQRFSVEYGHNNWWGQSGIFTSMRK